MGNPTLEALQRKSYEEDLKTAEYSFTCKQEGIICPESPKITIEGEGIRLHFFRYGLLDRATPVQDETDIKVDKAVIAKENDAHILLLNNQTGDVIDYNSDTKETKDTVELDEVIVKKEKFEEYGIPKLKNFNITRTALTTGYIYLINDEDPNEYYELAVDEYGMLSHILWEYSKDKATGEYLDVRKQQSEKISYKIVEKGKKLRVAFSPVQWSRKYFNEINADDDKKKALMMLIDCNGFPKNHQVEETADLLPFNQVKATFPNQHPSASILQDNLNDIFITEREQDEKGENDILEDMFISFNDPTAAADEICLGLDREVTRLQAIMTSLQTGKSSEEIFSILMKGEKIPIEDSKTIQQTQYLFRLAQLSYDFVYNNHENTDKYGEKNVGFTANLYSAGLLQAFFGHGGAHKEKLEKILGKEERLAQRAVIDSYRDDLGNFMTSDYYQDSLDYYFSGIADDIEDAKGLVAEHFIALGQYPNMYDRHLDLKSEYQLVNDNWYKKINETLYNEDPEHFKKSTKILDTPLDINDFNVLSLTKKTVKQIEKIFKAYANHETYVGAFVALKQMPITGKVSYFRDKKTREVTFKFKGLEDFKTEINGTKLRYEINGKPATLKQYKKHWHLEYEKMSKQSVQELVNSGKMEVNLKTNLPKRFKAQAEKLLKSNAFGGVVLMIEAYVWAKAVKQFSKDSSNRKNREKLGFTSIKLAAASLSLVENMKLFDYFKTKGNKGLIIGRGLTSITKVLKITGSAITVFTASRDSYISFSVRDNDAATIYAMAAGVGATFVAAELGIGAVAVFAIGFWPAALLGGALIGLYYVVEKYFKDTELETYFKNFPLSDYAVPPNPSETSLQYITRLVTNPSATLVDPIFDSTASDEFKTYSNFEKAYTALLDILVPSITIVEPQPHQYVNYRKGFDKTNANTNRFKAYIYSAQKIDDHNQLDIQAWYYPYGINTKAPLRPNGRIEIDTFIHPPVKPKTSFNTEEIAPNWEVEFGIPPSYEWNFENYTDGEVLFICRIRVDNDQFTPTNFKTAPRYIYGHAQTHNRRVYDTRDLTLMRTLHGLYGKRYHVKNVKLIDVSEEVAMLKPKIVSKNNLDKLSSYIIKQ